MAIQRNLKKAPADIFWGEIAACEHVVQIYRHDRAFLDALQGFVEGGFAADECVVVIATREHIAYLNERLLLRGFDIAALRKTEQYIELDAEETLSQFMTNGWPDDGRFISLVTSLLNRARARGRQVRAFGEMVALLWAQGHNGATVRLEHLWHQLCEECGFSLFCAYPQSGFTQDVEASVREICATHSKVLHA